MLPLVKRIGLRAVWLAIAMVGAGVGPTLHAAASAVVDFNFEVRPLLSDRCFSCHGPDERARKAKLRLDQREDVLRVRQDGRRVVAPGDPEASELIRRLFSEDPDEVMPPPEAHLALTDPEKALLRRWVAQGAPWSDHWAFAPIIRPEPPAVNAGDRGIHPVDQFVLARLHAAGLEPSPRAGRERLIRRVSLDLTGLPPSPREVEAFVKDPSENAYEKVVDRLLASPAFGERLATDWLDLARYADTYGYQADVERDLSPWRDWVVAAFNRNLPYDQFLTWQLAGDLLPGATDEQVLATAFNRLHRQTNEGGSIEEEFRQEYVSDRVHTMGTAFLGLTLECSRCHDHKYDPISQRDYYALSAFFNNIDESGLYSHFTTATPTPTLVRWEGEDRDKHRALVRERDAADEQLRLAVAAARARWDAGERPEAPSPAQVLPVASYAFDVFTHPFTPDARSTNQAVLSDGPVPVPGRRGTALRFSGDNAVTLPSAGSFRRTDPFSVDVWIRPADVRPRAVVFHYSRAWTDSASRGYELVLENGRPFFGLIHFWPGNALGVRARDVLPPGRWTRLTVTYDGSSRAAGVQLYRDGKPMALETVRDGLTRDIQHRAAWGDADAGGIRLTLGARFRDNGFRDGELDDFRVYDVCLTPAEVRHLDPDTGAPAADAMDAETYAMRWDPGVAAAHAALQRLRKAEDELISKTKEIMVMRELEARRPTYLLKRGAYDAPADPVDPDVPERILPLPEGTPRTRLGLARWMTDPRNPLTARVAVNRAWRQYFGRGLVATLNDFGAQGQLPTHPELLDWLAATFRDSGWDLKALHKLLVLSATYCQDSEAPPERVALDPDNRMLSRGPRHRLGAEQIRDSALAVSGLLQPTLGGPSVKPYQPPGVWEEAGTGKTYVQDHGDKLYRRSLYTFIRRTAPPPSLVSFDAGSREVCVANREITATPLQALVLLNDPQFLEAARVLAEELWRDREATPEARMDRGFRTVLGRPPSARETAILASLFEEQRRLYAADPEAAERLLSTGNVRATPHCRRRNWRRPPLW